MRLHPLVLFVLLLLAPITRAQEVTPAPFSLGELEPITAENAGRLEQLGQFELDHPVTDIAWSPDGHIFAVITTTDIWLYDATDWQTQPMRLSVTDSQSHSIAFSSDSRLLAYGSRESPLISLWDTQAKAQVLQIEAGSSVSSLDFNRENTLLAASGGGFWLFDVATGEELAYSSPYDGINKALFSPDGNLIAFDDYPNNIRLISVAKTLENHSARRENDLASLGTPYGWSLYDFAFSSDGALIASGSVNAVVQVWKTAEILKTPTVKLGQEHYYDEYFSLLTEITFSPNGELLVFSIGNVDEPHMIKLLRVETYSELASVAAQSGWNTGLEFNPQGTLLAYASEDGTIWFYGVHHDEDN